MYGNWPNGDCINCYDVQNVGRAIHAKLDNCIDDAKIKRADCIRTLQVLHVGVKVDKKLVHIDPSILFTRLTAIVETDDNVADHFEFEVTPELT